MSQLAQSRELRRHLRVDFRRHAWCEHRDWTQYLTITNLSHGGLFIQTPTPFANGELLRVSFVDGGQRVALHVEVMWSSRSRRVGVGCQIIAVPEGDERYTQLVERLAGTR
jgi:Tfp pilus assembly protein PilZ